MNSNRLKGLMIIVPLVMLVAGGCGKSGNQTVARVGDYEIKTEELNQYFSQMPVTFGSAEEEYNKRREILDSMIVTRLLIQGAYELNIDKVDDLARAVAANKDRFLMGVLYNKHIVSKVEPTEAEMRDYYNHLENRLRVSHIIVTDPDTAQMLFERVKNGENFEQLAFEYSIDPDAKRNKGDLGYLLWGATVDEFQQAAFAMEPGQVSRPVKSRYGYHIIKVVDKKPNENRGEFDVMEETIKNQLMRRKSMALMEEYFDALKLKYPVAIDTATCDYLMHKREQLYPPQVLAGLPRSDFDIEALDRNEKELVLATWQGGQVTLLEYLTRIKDVPQAIRPNLDDYDSLATVVFELKKQEILTSEALAEGLDQDEEYLKQLRMFKEFNMADIMKNDSIQSPPPPEEADLRKYYEENLDEFTTPAKFRVHEILLSDEMKARKLAGEIRSLSEFKQKAAELTERPGKRSRQGDLGFIEKAWYPEIFEAADKIGIGRIGGPVATGNKYSIFYVVDKTEPEIKDFLDVKRRINDKLLVERKNQAIQIWIDERLKTTSVDVDEDAIWATIDVSKYDEKEEDEG
ncbi:MAG: peptidylprolyl isomerase [Candidatus Zixiibacteriota bacterium]|nr:MAG: peptidylprolyl isomerase [candidate division Zixibacteria bacterium]